MRSGLFRTHMFGGYKKEDVERYIERLESEISRFETEAKSDPVVQVQSAPESSPELEDVIVLNDDSELHEPDLPRQPKVQQEPNLSRQPGIQQETTDSTAEIERLKADLKEERLKCEQASRLLQRIIYEKQQLADELEELRREVQSYSKDRDAIKEVLMNAKINAEVVMTQARREARLLLEDTRRQISAQKRETMAQLMGQLSENYSGLQASKYVLEEQVKTIESMEQQIEDIRNRMQDDFGETTI